MNRSDKDEIARLKSEVICLQNKNFSLSKENENYISRLKTISKDISSKIKNEIEIKKNAAALRREQEHQAAIAKAEQDRLDAIAKAEEEKQQAIEAERNRVSVYREKLEIAESELAELRKQIKSERASAIANNELKEKVIFKINSEIDALKRSARDAKESSNSYLMTLNGTKKIINSANIRAEKAEQKNIEYKNENTKLKNEINVLRNDINNLIGKNIFRRKI